MDKFCYLGDMLSVDVDADAAVQARIWIGWNILARPCNSKWIPDYKILNPESQDSENPSGIGIAS